MNIKAWVRSMTQLIQYFLTSTHFPGWWGCHLQGHCRKCGRVQNTLYQTIWIENFSCDLCEAQRSIHKCLVSSCPSLQYNSKLPPFPVSLLPINLCKRKAKTLHPQVAVYCKISYNYSTHDLWAFLSNKWGMNLTYLKWVPVRI